MVNAFTSSIVVWECGNCGECYDFHDQAMYCCTDTPRDTYKLEYHVFRDGQDMWVDTYEEAEAIIKEWQAEDPTGDMRIYKDTYATKEDYDNGVQNDEDCMWSQGGFPC